MGFHERFEDLSLESAERINQVCRRFEAAWKECPEPWIEDYLGAVAEPWRSVLLCELLKVELDYRRRDYYGRFPGHEAMIDAVLAGTLARIGGMSSGFSKHSTDLPLELAQLIDRRCDQFEAELKAEGPRPLIGDYVGGVPEPGWLAAVRRLIELELFYRDHPPNISYYLGSTQAVPTKPPSTASTDGEDHLLESQSPLHTQSYRIGHFRLLGKLGEGSFGEVYLAQDEKLDRKVAIKLPQRKRKVTEIEVQEFLAEARTLAGLDHPHIVPVFEYGRAAAGRCYVVSKYIAGGNLKDRLTRGRVYPPQAAYLVLQIAWALGHAHARGLVHRDIKPENILLDSTGRALVADFGLALNAADWGPVALPAGTLPYMSPEQAAGEVKTLDGRSDLFSLGIVFYELLTGSRPFEGRTRSEVRDEIRHAELLPPQEIRPGIPDELGRICLRCLEKRPVDRF